MTKDLNKKKRTKKNQKAKAKPRNKRLYVKTLSV